MLKDYLKALFKTPLYKIFSKYTYGTYHAPPKDNGATVCVKCPKCNADDYWHLFIHTSWFVIFLVPLIPYKSEYFLRCRKCGEEIALRQSEIAKTMKLNKFVRVLSEEKSKSIEPNDAEIKAWLTKRIILKNGEHINKNENTVWNIINDKFSDAIKLSNYKPQVAIDEMDKLLLESININANNAEGRTLLKIAQYLEVPKEIERIIKSNGGI